jgi:hypothetical protein
MTKKLSNLLLTLTAITLFCAVSATAQTKSVNKPDEVTYNLKIEDMTSEYKLQKITNLLDNYKDRIVKYETVLPNKEVKLTLKESENIVNLLEVLSNHGYTAWYKDDQNNRVVNSGRGFTEKIQELK